MSIAIMFVVLAMQLPVARESHTLWTHLFWVVFLKSVGTRCCPKAIELLIIVILMKESKCFALLLNFADQSGLFNPGRKPMLVLKYVSPGPIAFICHGLQGRLFVVI